MLLDSLHYNIYNITMSNTFLQTQITNTQNLITTYQAAVTSLVAGEIQSYTLNTGQTTQTVTNANIGELNKQIDILYNRLATLEARCNGASGIVIPGW